ncbi:MAG: DUF2061 domain-containing protein, partial [Burkholderiales bacterium]|nr:DUF2061 domain-containing protein [Burkholderiales bacterium]
MCQKITDTRRDLAKTASFAALHFGVAFLVAWLLTGSVTVAMGIGLIEPLANTVAFFFHERAWARAEAHAAPANAPRGAAGAPVSGAPYNRRPRSGSARWPSTTKSSVSSISAASTMPPPARCATIW